MVQRSATWVRSNTRRHNLIFKIPLFPRLKRLTRTCLSTPTSSLAMEISINYSYQADTDTLWDRTDQSTWERKWLLIKLTGKEQSSLLEITIHSHSKFPTW